MSALAWIGRRARWILALGVLAALAAPSLSAWLRPALPAFVALVYALAMARIDLGQVARRALGPRRLLGSLAAIAALMLATPALFLALGRAAGLDPPLLAALVYLGASPPIASAASLCLMLRLDAARALELSVLGALAAPVLGPIAAELLLGARLPLDALAFSLRIAAMVAAGALAALILRRMLGAARIAARADAFDGVATLAMLLFILPLYDGAGAAILADPARALQIGLVAVAANFAVQIAAATLARQAAPAATSGAFGVLWGNRTVAMYAAALPPDPTFGLFVALYQIPMLFTPLALGRFYRRAAA